MERSLETKAHSEESMNVSDMKVTDKDDFLSRSMMIKAKNIIMKERIWINRVISKIETQPLESDTDARLHEERIIAVQEEPSLHVNSERVVPD